MKEWTRGGNGARSLPQLSFNMGKGRGRWPCDLCTGATYIWNFLRLERTLSTNSASNWDKDKITWLMYCSGWQNEEERSIATLICPTKSILMVVGLICISKRVTYSSVRLIHRCDLYTDFSSPWPNYWLVRLIHRCDLYTGKYGR